MEPITPVAAIKIFTRDRQACFDFRLSGVEGRVKTRNLRHLRRNPPHLPQRAQTKRQMQRRQRPQLFQFVLHMVVNNNG